MFCFLIFMTVFTFHSHTDFVYQSKPKTANISYNNIRIFCLKQKQYGFGIFVFVLVFAQFFTWITLYRNIYLQVKWLHIVYISKKCLKILTFERYSPRINLATISVCQHIFYLWILMSYRYSMKFQKFDMSQHLYWA